MNQKLIHQCKQWILHKINKLTPKLSLKIPSNVISVHSITSLSVMWKVFLLDSPTSLLFLMSFLHPKIQSRASLLNSLPNLLLPFNNCSFLAFPAFARMVGLAWNCEAVTHLETFCWLFSSFYTSASSPSSNINLAKLIPVKVQHMVLLL